jgi:hypothetical protein
MFRKLLPALAGCALLALTGTAAAETQLSTDRAEAIDATPGWTAWRTFSEDWFLWHGGAVEQSPPVASMALGTDTRGRAVALEWPSSGGRVVERRLSDGSVRQLPRRVAWAADENRGTLAYVRRDLGIYVLRHGAKHVRRVSKVDAWSLALGRRWLVYEGNADAPDQAAIAAIDLNRSKPRRRVLAIDDPTDESCRCIGTYVYESDPTLDGRYAYWLETVESDPGVATPPEGTGSTILRVDLNAKRPVVESFSPEQPVEAFAVTAGVVYYGAADGGVFRVGAPQWQATGRQLPVQG